MNFHEVAERACGFGAQQKPKELAALLALLDEIQPQIVVEVGCAEGGTLWAWQQYADTVIGIDESVVYQIIAPTTATIINRDSHDPFALIDLTIELEGQPIDMLFLDGDHSYSGVRADHETYGSLVRAGGLVAFHDIVSIAPSPDRVGEHEVTKYWAEIRDHHCTEIIDDTPGSGGAWGDQWGGIGVFHL